MKKQINFRFNFPGCSSVYENGNLKQLRYDGKIVRISIDYAFFQPINISPEETIITSHKTNK